MAIPLYGVEAHTGQIITIDDEAVVKDQAAANGTGGSAFAPYLVSTPFDDGLDGGYSRIRRIVQHIHAAGAVTVDVIPYRDLQESGSGYQEVMAVGADPIVTAPVDESGTNFQVKVKVSSFDAAVEIGKGLQYVVPRRSSR